MILLQLLTKIVGNNFTSSKLKSSQNIKMTNTPLEREREEEIGRYRKREKERDSSCSKMANLLGLWQNHDVFSSLFYLFSLSRLLPRSLIFSPQTPSSSPPSPAHHLSPSSLNLYSYFFCLSYCKQVQLRPFFCIDYPLFKFKKKIQLCIDRVGQY